MPTHEKAMSLEEAIRLFAAKANDNDKQALCTFVDMQPSTFTAWKSASNIRPVGLGRVRIRHFLEYRGYHIDEIEGLKEPILSLSRMLAFGVLTPSQLAEELGVKKERDIFTVLFSIVSPKLFRLKRIASVVQKYQDVLKAKLPIISSRKAEALVAAIVAPTAELSSEAKQALIATFAALAKPLIPVVETLVSDAFTAEERKKIRAQLGSGNGVFQLQMLLASLCSETARSNQRN